MQSVTRVIPLVAVVLVSCSCHLARAQGIVTDVKLGALAHDVPILGGRVETGVDLNGELIFASPVPSGILSGIEPRWRWLFQPQPNVGFEANTNGDTSQLYFGLTWTVDLDNGGVLWPDDAVFLAISFGPAFNTGHVSSTASNKLSLGSNVLFHPALELGYRITPQWSVSLFFDHSSNAGLARYNEGLGNLGVRVGLHF